MYQDRRIRQGDKHGRLQQVKIPEFHEWHEQFLTDGPREHFTKKNKSPETQETFSCISQWWCKERLGVDMTPDKIHFTPTCPWIWRHPVITDDGEILRFILLLQPNFREKTSDSIQTKLIIKTFFLFTKVSFLPIRLETQVYNCDTHFTDFLSSFRKIIIKYLFYFY